MIQKADNSISSQCSVKNVPNQLMLWVFLLSSQVIACTARAFSIRTSRPPFEDKRLPECLVGRICDFIVQHLSSVLCSGNCAPYRAECTPVMTGVTGVRTLVRIEIFSAPQSVLRGAPQSDLGVQQLHPSQNWLHPSQLPAPQSTVNHILAIFVMNR